MPFFFAPPAVDLNLILDDPKLAGAIVSASVITIDGQTVFERNSGLHMTPASNQKLLTAAYALWKLTPTYRPITRFWKRNNSVIVDSPGDPLLEFEQLVGIRRKLKLGSAATVNLRQAYWPGFPDGWELDDLPNKYAAPITAFSVNQAAFELWAEKGNVVGKPSLFGNKVKVSPSSAKLKVTYDPILRQIFVEGKIPGAATRLDTLSVSEPDVQAAKLLGPGLRFTSQVPNVQPDGTITGKTVAELVKECLPPSDNNIAEHLLLMSALKGLPPMKDPYPLARKSLSTFLTNVVGAASDDVRTEDGSGMSRHSFVTTRALTRLLRWANEQPTAPAWRAAMVVPGQGTLKNRLAGVSFSGKTGTLDMVVALSGYVRRKSGQDLAVSIIINQFGGSSGEARDIADAFVSEVANVELSPETR